MIRQFTLSDLVAAARGGDQRLLGEFDSACAELGAFALVGMPVPGELLERVHRDTLALFSLPAEQKERLRSPDGNPYIGWDGAAGDPGPHAAKRKQMYHIGPRVAPTLTAPEADGAFPERSPGSVDDCPLWPVELPEFTDSWHEYYRHMQQATWLIGEVMAAALRIPLPRWRALCAANWADLAANYYPAAEPGDTGARNKVHSDVTLFTVLYQDDGGGGGLRMQVRTGEWVDVPPVAGTYLVNVGELLAFLTDGRWWAVPHEVSEARTDDPAVRTARVSIPFFYRPNDALTISPLFGEGEQLLIREWLDRRRPATATS
jgi:isopenicillin N synthase-like dioxygenase